MPKATGWGVFSMSVTIARKIRKQLTPQEAKLWNQLRYLRREGFHFRRQAPLGGYVLDFACFPFRLVVEVDGGQHASGLRLEADQIRDAVLRKEGFKVLRFWNIDVDMDGVIETILPALRQSTPTRQPSAATLLTRGEG